MSNQDTAPGVTDAVATLFPQFDEYVKRQTVLNDLHIQQIQKEEERRIVLNKLEQEKQEERFSLRLQQWTVEEARHIDSCDGGSVRAVREWVASIRLAGNRTIDSLDRNVSMLKLIDYTISGDLFRSVSAFVRNKKDVKWGEVLLHVLNAFLGPNEQDALKDVLEHMRQNQREDVLSYNRRFRHAADLAYPTPTDSDQAHVTLLYMRSLLPGRLQVHLIDKDPKTFDSALAITEAEHAKIQRRDRVLQSVTRSEEPMEVDSIGESARERIQRQERELRELKRRLGNRERSSDTTSTSGGKMCWFCKESGHFKSNCPKRKAFWRNKGGNPRPLPESERSLN
jgi:predicted Zn-ribbon and HTH transcriptional regulator